MKDVAMKHMRFGGSDQEGYMVSYYTRGHNEETAEVANGGVFQEEFFTEKEEAERRMMQLMK